MQGRIRNRIVKKVSTNHAAALMQIIQAAITGAVKRRLALAGLVGRIAGPLAA
jgi:hypothetical protein